MFSRRYWNDPPNELFTELHNVTATSLNDGGALRVHEDAITAQHAIATAVLRKEIQGATRVDVELKVTGARAVGICFDSDNGNADQYFDTASNRILHATESSVFVMDAIAEPGTDGRTRLGVLFVGSNLSEYFSIRLALAGPDSAMDAYAGSPDAGFDILGCEIRSLGI
jgi:hypothetical protein